MQRITNTQRKYLRSLAHHLRPVVQIGKQGVTAFLLEKVDRELNAHELIKLRFLDFRDQKQELAQSIAESSGSSLVNLVGNVATLYRENPDPEKRSIVLPADYTDEAL
jgi:RNA-binding protein